MRRLATSLGAAILGLTLSATASAEYFIRASSSPVIVREEGSSYCTIGSEAQLQAYGETAESVTVLPPSTYESALATRVDKGQCPWPVGCYYLGGSHSFFTVTGTDVCRFEATSFPPDCRVIQDVGPLLAALHDRGECPPAR